MKNRMMNIKRIIGKSMFLLLFAIVIWQLVIVYWRFGNNLYIVLGR